LLPTDPLASSSVMELLSKREPRDLHTILELLEPFLTTDNWFSSRKVVPLLLPTDPLASSSVMELLSKREPRDLLLTTLELPELFSTTGKLFSSAKVVPLLL